MADGQDRENRIKQSATRIPQSYPSSDVANIAPMQSPAKVSMHHKTGSSSITKAKFHLQTNLHLEILWYH